MERSDGARLALLLLEGFEALVGGVVRELEQQGHPGVTATHEFALAAIDEGAGSASELARRLGVSKQAAAKTITALEQFGYLERAPDPDDARRKHLRVTARGYEMTAIGAAAFEDLRTRWADRVGLDRVEAAEAALRQLRA